MWRQFFELFRQVLTLTEDTQRNRAEIKMLCCNLNGGCRRRLGSKLSKDETC